MSSRFMPLAMAFIRELMVVMEKFVMDHPRIFMVSIGRKSKASFKPILKNFVFYVFQKLLDMTTRSRICYLIYTVK